MATTPDKTKRRRLRSPFVVTIATGAAAGVVAIACGTSQPGPGAQGQKPPGTTGGGPCSPLGATQNCHINLGVSGGVQQCFTGTETCIAGQWSACGGSGVVQSRNAHISARGYMTESMMDAGPDTGAVNNGPICSNDPCDPYCNEFDVPDGGGLGDGGSGSSGPPYVAGDAGQLPGSYSNYLDHNCEGGSCGVTSTTVQTTSNGLSACPPTNNTITNPCTAAPYQDCQQDFHCAAGVCVWNNPSYTDAACTDHGGIDVTIGAGCVAGANQNLPVCNRGTQPIPSGTTLGINLLNPAQYTAWNTGACPNLGAATCSVTLSSALAAGTCIDVTSCSWAGDKYAVVNSGTGAITECSTGGKRCANNAAFIKTNGPPGCAACSTGCTTSLNGTIYDPAGINPLYGVLVYVPTTPVLPLPPGEVCDTTCASLISGTPSVEAITQADGTFVLNGVPAGVSFPLVIQTGKWRRQVTVPAIASCGSATLAAPNDRLPRTEKGGVSGAAGEGDIPQFALVTGQGDQLECLLRKIGIADTEFTTDSGIGRVHMYQYNGATIAGIQQASTLWNSTVKMANYDAIIEPCHNIPYNSLAIPITAAEQANHITYANAGGRLFMSHQTANNFVYTQPNPTGWPGTAVWDYAGDATDRAPPTLTDNVDQTFADGAAMAYWLNVVGASPVIGQLALPDYRHDLDNVVAPTHQFVYGNSSSGGHAGSGPIENIISFDTPVGLPPASQCGRAIIPMMHVLQLGSGAFPGECGAISPMGSQEAAFEFMFFETTACLAAPPQPQSGCENYQYTGGTGSAAFYACQMDSYCDPLSTGGTGQCIQFAPGDEWPKTEGKVTAGLVDLTIEQGCNNPEGAGWYKEFPICNRGNTTLTPAMSLTGKIAVSWWPFDPSMGINLAPPYAPPGANAPGTCIPVQAAPQCKFAIPAGGLAPGQCFLGNLSDATSCGANAQAAEPADNQLLFVNSDYAVPEDTLTPVAALTGQITPQPGCANNWGDQWAGSGGNSNNPPACGGISFTTQTATYTYASSCPAGFHSQWALLTYNATIGVSAPSDSAEVLFQVATQPVYSDGGVGPLTSYVKVADAKGVNGPTNLGDPAVCTMAGPAATTPATACSNGNGNPTPACCPKSIAQALEMPAASGGLGSVAGIVADQNTNLSLQITINPSSDGTQSASVNSWQVSFDCVPSE